MSAGGPICAAAAATSGTQRLGLQAPAAAAASWAAWPLSRTRRRWDPSVPGQLVSRGKGGPGPLWTHGPSRLISSESVEVLSGHLRQARLPSRPLRPPPRRGPPQHPPAGRSGTEGRLPRGEAASQRGRPRLPRVSILPQVGCERTLPGLPVNGLSMSQPARLQFHLPKERGGRANPARAPRSGAPRERVATARRPPLGASSASSRP